MDDWPGRLRGELFTECAGWIWEQLQDEGVLIAGELVELVLQVERELAVHTRPLEAIATAVEAEFAHRGIAASSGPVPAAVIAAVLQWEDDFLGFAAIPRAES